MTAKPQLITVSNGLLDAKHRRAMGPAIWVYLLLVDWQTDLDGSVLAKKRDGVQLQDIANRLDLPVRTVGRHLAQLRPYLDIKRLPNGLRIRIKNPKKLFKRVGKSSHPGTAKSGHSEERDRPNFAGGIAKSGRWQKTNFT